jgi:RimJ/RimL family protein N-acetyltransferase
MNVFGPRIRIRPTVQGDLPFLQTLWNDGSVMRCTGYPDGMHVTDGCMARWWEMTPQAHTSPHTRLLTPPHCLIVRADGTSLGEISYSLDADGRARVDLKLAPAHWGQGYATEALTLLLRELFATTAIRCVVVEPSPANAPALRLFERCGFHPTPTDNHPDRWTCTRVDFAARRAVADVA